MACSSSFEVKFVNDHGLAETMTAKIQKRPLGHHVYDNQKQKRRNRTECTSVRIEADCVRESRD